MTIRARCLFRASRSPAASTFSFSLPFRSSVRREELLDGAELLDELGGRLLPHPGHAGDVVGRVPLEGHVLEVLRRRDAVPLLDGRLVHEVDVGDPAPVEQDAGCAGPDELEEVTVGGDDRRVDPLLGRPEARVPIASSASWPSTRTSGIRRASRTSSISPSWGRKSAGVSRRPALYSASISSRTVGLPTSKATAIRSGRSSARSLMSIEVNP